MQTGTIRKKATLTEVAALAGVSRSMAAYVLRSPKDCSARPETRKRILDAAKSLSYRSDFTARALRSGNSCTVGMVIPSTMGYYQELMIALDRTFAARGYYIFFSFWQAGKQDEFEQAFERMYSLNVAGIITPHYVHVPMHMNVPVILWGNDRPEYDSVFPDKVAYGHEVVARLVAAGHREIGFAGLQQDARWEAIVESLRVHDCPIRPEYFVESAGTRANGVRAMEKIASLKHRPTAMIMHSDDMALGAMYAAKRLGMEIPRDCSIVGFDNLPEGRYSFPELTTFDQCFASAAELLAETLLNRIREPERPRQSRVIPVRYIERSTICTPCKTGKE